MYCLSEVVRKYSFCKHRKKGHDHRSLLLLSIGDIDFTVDPAPLELKKHQPMEQSSNIEGADRLFHLYKYTCRLLPLFSRSCQSVNLSTYHLLACQLVSFCICNLHVSLQLDLLQNLNTTINRVTIYKYKNTILEAADILLRANTTCQEMSLALSWYDQIIIIFIISPSNQQMITQSC